MKVNFYPIPARQALAQDVKPKEQAELIESTKDGGAVIMYEDGSLEIVPITHLQKVQAVVAKKTPLTKADSKKSN
jgi:hypothetical protein